MDTKEFLDMEYACFEDEDEILRTDCYKSKDNIVLQDCDYDNNQEWFFRMNVEGGY